MRPRHVAAPMSPVVRFRTRRAVESALILAWLLTSTRVFLDPFARPLSVILLAPALLCWAIYARRLSWLAILYFYLMVAWVAYTDLMTGVLEIQTTFGQFVRITGAILVATTVGRRLFVLYPLWVTRLSAAGLPVFALGAAFPPIISAVYAAAPSFVTVDPRIIEGQVAWRRVSLGFVTLSPDRSYQNHGFMWEPAAFALMTVTALAMRVAQGRGIANRSGIILVLATLTTLSTTGFIALAVVLLYWLAQKRGIGPVLAVATAPAIITTFISLNFLWQKIQDEFDAGYGADVTWTLSRYASFIRDMSEFATKPLLGAGLFEAARPLYDAFQPSNNGLTDFLVRFGLLWTLITLGMYAYSFRAAAGFRWGGACLVLATLLIFSWSEKFFELPIFMALQLSATALAPRLRARHARRFRVRTSKRRGAGAAASLAHVKGKAAVLVRTGHLKSVRHG